MAQFRVVQAADPRVFIEEAAKHGYDDCSLNTPLGVLADSFIEYQIQARHLSEESRKVFAVYRGDALVLVLSCVAGEPSVSLGSPRSAELTKEELDSAMSQLAPAVAATVDPQSLSSVWGDADVCSAFVDAWVAVFASRGIKASGPPPYFVATTSYATRATLPTTPPPSLGALRLAPATADDTDALAELLAAFSVLWNTPLTAETARPRIVAHIACGEAWVCRAADGAAVAFCIVGRATPRTIAIKNVYVAPEHRRKGIASALVSAMLRYFLGVPEHGVEGPLVPAKGVKKEVCLNVGEDHVERMYAKCGFLFGDAREPGFDKRPWFTVVGRDVKIEQS
ncbi:GNAT family N-acetyltransferase [Phanerochaete sordida]|uniref:GNAT family N-acetyltransferase n=1 Tax=Phanerochaete sordida TaxID=48140 RepID=A0A9P3LCQ4_9APHY|nr:GNAT family N-acetyltransferase [Phanerochaete sordida]